MTMSTLTRLDVELGSGALEFDDAEPLAAALDSELSVSISNQPLAIIVVADPLVVDIAASLTCEVD